MGIHDDPEEILASPDHPRHAAGRRVAGICPGLRVSAIHLHDLLVALSPRSCELPCGVARGRDVGTFRAYDR